jgi:hypothetical protein
MPKAKAISVASLSPVRLEIINTTTAQVSFDTTEFIGQSVRVTQRVGLVGPNDSSAGMAQRLVEVLRALELEPLKNVQALLQRTLDAYGNRADATNLDRAAVQVATLLNEFLFPVSVLDVVPMASQAGRLCKALGKGAARLNALERGDGLLAKETGKAAENASAKQIKVIGRLSDTAAAKRWPGYDVLDILDWTPAKNAKWVEEGIEHGQIFYTATPEAGNLIQTAGRFAGHPTIYADEIRQLKQAGYVKVGDYYVPASKAATFKP